MNKKFKNFSNLNTNFFSDECIFNDAQNQSSSSTPTNYYDNILNDVKIPSIFDNPYGSRFDKFMYQFEKETQEQAPKNNIFRNTTPDREPLENFRSFNTNHNENYSKYSRGDKTFSCNRLTKQRKTENDIQKRIFFMNKTDLGMSSYLHKKKSQRLNGNMHATMRKSFRKQTLNESPTDILTLQIDNKTY